MDIILEKKAKKYIRNAFILVVIMILVSLVPVIGWDWLSNAYNIAGIILPIITLASVFLILANLHIQQRFLQVQKEEIRITQQEVKRQGITMRKQRFDNTFFILLNYLVEAHKEILMKNQNIYSTIHQELIKEVTREYAQRKPNIEKIRICQEDSNSHVPKFYFEITLYEILYNACLNLEQRRLGLGLGSDYTYFIQAIKLIEDNKEFLSTEDIKYYFQFLILELNPNFLDIILYKVVYIDEKNIINFLDKNELVDNMSQYKGPIYFSQDRSFWKYVKTCAGNLHPKFY